MTDSKFANSYSFTFENFVWNVPENGDYVVKRDSSHKCHLRVNRTLHNGTEYLNYSLSPIHSFYWVGTNLEIGYNSYIVNHNQSSKVHQEIKEIIQFHDYTLEKQIEMVEILDERNGWLKNGTLTILVEVTIYTIISYHGCRFFPLFYSMFPNLKDLAEQYKDHIVNGEKPKFVLINFHAPNFPEINNEYDPYQLDAFLQLMHGVSPLYEPFLRYSMAGTLKKAKKHNALNVRCICEKQIIRCPDNEYKWTYYHAFKYNFKSFLSVLLKEVKSPKKLKKILKDKKWERSSAEIMKHLVAKFLSFA